MSEISIETARKTFNVINVLHRQAESRIQTLQAEIQTIYADMQEYKKMGAEYSAYITPAEDPPAPDRRHRRINRRHRRIKRRGSKCIACTQHHQV